MLRLWSTGCSYHFVSVFAYSLILSGGIQRCIYVCGSLLSGKAYCRSEKVMVIGSKGNTRPLPVACRNTQCYVISSDLSPPGLLKTHSSSGSAASRNPLQGGRIYVRFVPVVLPASLSQSWTCFAETRWQSSQRFRPSLCEMQSPFCQSSSQSYWNAGCPQSDLTGRVCCWWGAWRQAHNRLPPSAAHCWIRSYGCCRSCCCDHCPACILMDNKGTEYSGQKCIHVRNLICTAESFACALEVLPGHRYLNVDSKERDS